MRPLTSVPSGPTVPEIWPDPSGLNLLTPLTTPSVILTFTSVPGPLHVPEPVHTPSNEPLATLVFVGEAVACFLLLL